MCYIGHFVSQMSYMSVDWSKIILYDEMCGHIGYLSHLISYMANLIIEKLLYDNNMCHIGYNI